MQYIGDFHIHSHYSRATSKDMNIEELDKWARIKGIDVLGTGDFTHPAWFRELQEKLEPAEKGLFKLRGQTPVRGSDPQRSEASYTRFMLTVEVSSIYSEGGQVRRIHNIVFAPSFEAAAKLNRKLGEVGNLRADGRPILGLPAHELLRMTLDTSEDCLLVPAHAWTPWFSIFGSKSGFDSIEECFGDLSKYIYAIETGLSSDPAMNWRLSVLDNITLISNSDCHSARRIGREANVFSTQVGPPPKADKPREYASGGEGDQLSYKNIIDAIKRKGKNLKLVETIEFFPEEGKYHYDGHRDCRVSMSPKESHKIHEICPGCGRPFTVGVLSRVEELADRPEDYVPKNSIPFRRLVPLDEIIAEALGVVGSQTKGVLKWHDNLIERFGSEFNVLLQAPIIEVEKDSLPEIAEALRRVRASELYIEPGYDGEYGKVKIFKEGEARSGKEQVSFFNSW